jgi:hypothetical protein
MCDSSDILELKLRVKLLEERLEVIKRKQESLEKKLR